MPQVNDRPDIHGADDRRRPGVEEFASVWAAALHRAHYVPISAQERHRIVAGLTDRLVAGVLTEPADAGAGQRIGAESRRLAALEQALLAKAFRGELVPQDPNNEPAAVLLERIREERATAGDGKAKRGRSARKSA